MLQDGSPVIRDGKGTVPFRTRGKDKDVVVDSFARREDDGAASLALLALFDSSDTADLDGTVALHEKVVVGNENGIFELALGGCCHADGRREVKGKGTRSHEGERSRVCINLGGEDAGDCSTRCATTDDDDAFAVTLRHCTSGEWAEERGRR